MAAPLWPTYRAAGAIDFQSIGETEGYRHSALRGRGVESALDNRHVGVVRPHQVGELLGSGQEGCQLGDEGYELVYVWHALIIGRSRRKVKRGKPDGADADANLRRAAPPGAL